MDKEKLLRTARALGLRAYDNEVLMEGVKTGEEHGHYLYWTDPALPVWLVYGPGGILEKMKWEVYYSVVNCKHEMCNWMGRGGDL